MKKIKNHLQQQIKNELKKSGVLKSYKETFQNKQMHFLISNIAFLFQLEINYLELTNLEKMLINKNDKKMFCPVIEKMFFLSNDKKIQQIDHLNLAYFLYYIYQTSRYFYDKQNNSENIFINSQIPNNAIHQNTIKRNYYYAFIADLKKHYANYNEFVIEFLKLVL